MLPFEEALRMVLNSAQRLPGELVDITQTSNRILAEDIEADMDMPSCDKAVVDGYACRREDLANELTIIETIQAGSLAKKAIGLKQCAKIMTGAPVPKGADCVIMVEFTENPTGRTVRFVGEKTDDHIRQQGQDTKAGQVLLLKGVRIRPQHIAVLASVGHVQVLVAKRPKVAVIATGDELVEPQLKPSPFSLPPSLKVSAQSLPITASPKIQPATLTGYSRGPWLKMT